MSNTINITFSTCLYNLKNRHGADKHIEWMRGFIRIVNRFYLVIYTDEETYDFIVTEVNKVNPETRSRIKIVIKPYTDFYNYKYAEYWKSNNDTPECKLYGVADWRLNMLWCEKVHFVNETIERRYFDTDTEYYGWCDIGYFRDTLLPRFTMRETLTKSASMTVTVRDAPTSYSKMIRERWPNPAKINALDKNRVYYGCNVTPKHMSVALNYYSEHLSNIDADSGLPRTIYDKRAHFISGGFFITGREKMKWWAHTFQTTLEKYIVHNAVIQDDQQLIAHCIFTRNTVTGMDTGSDNDLCIMKVNETSPDKLWFMFRELLM
jgi:hypothetical protein